MRHKVWLTLDAERDLEEIYSYISGHDGAARADYVLDSIDEVIEKLSVFPEHGSYPKELLGLGIRDYRQVFFKPYRLIYRIIAQQVYIYLIVDGRRDMQTLLTKRLLGA